MNKTIYRFMSIILTTIAVCGVADSVDTATEQPQRIEVGTKKSTSNKHRSKRNHRKHGKAENNVKAKCFGSNWFAPAYQPTYYLKSIGADGETLVLGDESVWSIASNSAAIASRWFEGSPLIITPSKWYSQYSYYLTNKLTGESVTAKLSQGPLVKYSILIQQIDWNNGYVYLTNGTRWAVKIDDNFRYWQSGQAVLIGENTVGWFEKDYILININENNYVIASRL